MIRAAAVARGYTIEDLERVRSEKAAKRGGFEKRILLKTVVDPLETRPITDRICQNKAAILEKVSVPMLEKYCWLEDNLYKCNVSTNTEYQRKFSHYYRMRFVSPKYREAFFALFEEIKENPDIEIIGTHYHAPTDRAKSGAINQIYQCFLELWGDESNWKLPCRWINDMHDKRSKIAHGVDETTVEALNNTAVLIPKVSNVARNVINATLNKEYGDNIWDRVYAEALF